jgi:hypothetical protein
MLKVEQGEPKLVIKTKRAPTTPPPSTKTVAAPATVSEHGQGGGSTSKDTGRKPTAKETQTGYAIPAAAQPKSTDPAPPRKAAAPVPSGVNTSTGSASAALQGYTTSGPAQPGESGSLNVPKVERRSTATTTVSGGGGGSDETGSVGALKTKKRKTPRDPNAHLPIGRTLAPLSNVTAEGKSLHPVKLLYPLGEYGEWELTVAGHASVEWPMGTRVPIGRSAPDVKVAPTDGAITVQQGPLSFTDHNLAEFAKGAIAGGVNRTQPPKTPFSMDVTWGNTERKLIGDVGITVKSKSGLTTFGASGTAEVDLDLHTKLPTGQAVVISYGVDVELSVSGKPPEPPGPVVPVPKPLHHDVQAWDAIRAILWEASAGVALAGVGVAIAKLVRAGEQGQ